MNYYSELKKLVDKGNLEILYIMSPPRTLSTVIEIALTEYGDGQIHEPFHKRNRLSFEDGCKTIYERVLLLQNKLQKEKIKIVLKDISKYVSPEEWMKLVNISNRFVFTLREPSRQLFSLASRYANDIDGLEDELSFEQIKNTLHRLPFEDLAQNYWQNLLELFDIAKKHVTSSREKKYIAVVCGTTFRYDPLDSTNKLVSHLDLKVAPEKVLHDWNKGSGLNFFKPEAVLNGIIEDKDMTKGPWLGRAINSSEFSSINNEYDSPQDIAIYDSKLKNYFLQHILPSFLTIYFDINNICKPGIDQVSKSEFAQSDFAQINPIETYLLCRFYMISNVETTVYLKNNCEIFRYNIRKRYPAISVTLFELA